MYTFYAVVGLTGDNADTCIYALFENKSDAEDYVKEIRDRFLSTSPITKYCQKHADALDVIKICEGFKIFEY